MNKTKEIKIFVFGTRGIPNIQGGVEKHCEQLYPEIASSYSVSIFRRKPYVDQSYESSWKGIRFVDLPSTQLKGLEAFFHSFLCAIVCLIKRPHIVHIHNIGPGIFTPLLRLFGLKVVITYHSPNYEHAKWGLIAKKVLLFGELLSLQYANHIIFVNGKQKDKFREQIGKKSSWIPNGVTIPIKSMKQNYITSLGLEPNRYILAVGRITQEKGFDYLIEAYQNIPSCGYKLVIAGGVDHKTNYAKQIQNMAQDGNVVLSGFVTGEELNQLYTHAKLFVLPSYNEGFPLVLLEAMSYNLDVLVSDIPANKEVKLPEDSYFRTGDQKDLSIKLIEKLAKEDKNIVYDMVDYNWNKIAQKTKSVYDKVLNRSNKKTK